MIKNLFLLLIITISNQDTIKASVAVYSPSQQSQARPVSISSRPISSSTQQHFSTKKNTDPDSLSVYDDSYFSGDAGYSGSNMISDAVSSITNWWYGAPQTQVAQQAAVQTAPKTKQKIVHDLELTSPKIHLDIVDTLDLTQAKKPTQLIPKFSESKKVPTDIAESTLKEPEYDLNKETSLPGADIEAYKKPQERLWGDVKPQIKNDVQKLTDTPSPEEKPTQLSIKRKIDTMEISTGAPTSDAIDPIDEDHEQPAQDLFAVVPRPLSQSKPHAQTLTLHEQRAVEEQAEKAASSMMQVFSFAADVVSLVGFGIAATVDVGMQKILPQDQQKPTRRSVSIKKVGDGATNSQPKVLDQTDANPQTTQAKAAAEKSFVASMKQTAQSIKDSPAKIKAFIRSLFEKLQIKLGMKKSKIPDEVIDQAAKELKPLLQNSENPGFASGMIEWLSNKTKVVNEQRIYTKEQQKIVWNKTKQSEYIHGAEKVEFTYKNGKFSDITVTYLGKEIKFQHGTGFTGRKNTDGSYSIELTPQSYTTLSRIKNDITKSILDAAGNKLQKGVELLSSNIYDLGNVEKSIEIGTAWTIQESTTSLERISIQFIPAHSYTQQTAGLGSRSGKKPNFIQITNVFKRANEPYPTQATFSADV